MKTSCASRRLCEKPARVYQREDGSVWLRCSCGFGCIAWPALREKFLDQQEV